MIFIAKRYMLWSNELQEYIAKVKVSKALSEMSEEIILELVLEELKKIDEKQKRGYQMR